MKTRILIIATSVLLSIVSAQEALANSDLELIFSGPVESSNPSRGELNVLGHEIVSQERAGLGVGSIVNVYGKLLSNGSVAGAVVEKVSDYATGSDPIYLKGHVTAVNPQIGRVWIGSTQIDYTNQLADSSFRIPALGETIEVLGTQPTAKGIVLAASIRSSAHQSVENKVGAELGVINTGSAMGVINTGNRLGVINTGSAMGVINTGNRLGVINTGSAMGVINTGNRLGVINTGSAMGVINTGNRLGVINTGSAMGVINTGNRLGVINTGSAMGVINTGNRLGVINTGSAMGVINTGNRLGVINTGSAMGVINTGNRLGVINTGSAMGVINTGNRLGVINTGSAMGVINTGSAAGIIQADKNQSLLR
jgi:hypothetical protein